MGRPLALRAPPLEPRGGRGRAPPVPSCGVQGAPARSPAHVRPVVTHPAREYVWARLSCGRTHTGPQTHDTKERSRLGAGGTAGREARPASPVRCVARSLTRPNSRHLLSTIGRAWTQACASFVPPRVHSIHSKCRLAKLSRSFRQPHRLTRARAAAGGGRGGASCAVTAEPASRTRQRGREEERTSSGTRP